MLTNILIFQFTFSYILFYVSIAKSIVISLFLASIFLHVWIEVPEQQEKLKYILLLKI